MNHYEFLPAWFLPVISTGSGKNSPIWINSDTNIVVNCMLSLSTRITLGYSPAHSAAFTTAQFSELLFKSRMSHPPRALTNPDALR